jgi:hypothetical protein
MRFPARWALGVLIAAPCIVGSIALEGGHPEAMLALAPGLVVLLLGALP